MKDRELIGTYKVESDMKRIDAAECPKYDRWVDVKAGEYPVYIYRTNESGRVGMAYVTFDDMSEIWYGFQLAKSDNFTPADGWQVRRYTYQSDWDGHDIETGEITRTGVIE